MLQFAKELLKAVMVAKVPQAVKAVMAANVILPKNAPIQKQKTIIKKSTYQSDCLFQPNFLLKKKFVSQMNYWNHKCFITKTNWLGNSMKKSIKLWTCFWSIRFNSSEQMSFYKRNMFFCISIRLSEILVINMRHWIPFAMVHSKIQNLSCQTNVILISFVVTRHSKVIGFLFTSVDEAHVKRHTRKCFEAKWFGRKILVSASKLLESSLIR